MSDSPITRDDLIAGVARAITPSPFSGQIQMPDTLRAIMSATAIREATRCISYLESAGAITYPLAGEDRS